MVIQFFVCAVGPEIYTAEGENVQRILFLSWLFNIIQDRDDWWKEFEWKSTDFAVYGAGENLPVG